MPRRPPIHWILRLIPALTLACATVVPVVPPLEWDPAPDHAVVSYGCYAGLVPMEYLNNAMPIFKLWGDGRAIWVEDQMGGSRTVRTATFTPDEMRVLLNEMASRHFFTLADAYEPDYEIMDGGVCQMRVALLGETKQVSEYTGSQPPDDYWALADLLAGGAGHPSDPYVPERGYLLTTLLQEPVSAATHTWPEDGIDGVRLADAQGGLLVEGEALRAAWDIVNTDLYATIASGQATYRIAVQIEGVTERWPGNP